MLAEVTGARPVQVAVGTPYAVKRGPYSEDDLIVAGLQSQEKLAAMVAEQNAKAMPTGETGYDATLLAEGADPLSGRCATCCRQGRPGLPLFLTKEEVLAYVAEQGANNGTD